MADIMNVLDKLHLNCKRLFVKVVIIFNSGHSHKTIHFKD